MISLIQKELKTVLGEGKINSQDLRFLKYNTSLSGTGLGNKVLLFVFIKDQNEPIAVVKTVRSNTDASVIRKGHINLMQLNAWVKGTEFASIFPIALTLYDQGTEIFSVESVCKGRHADRHRDLSFVMKHYSAFSMHVKAQLKETLTITPEYGMKLIDGLEGPKESIEGLRLYFRDVWGDTTMALPSIAQHGDFTFDNIRIDGDIMSVIDCDTFGTITLPGYDVFHLIVRSKIPNWKDIFNDYWRGLGFKNVPDKKLFLLFYLHELFIKKDYILKRKSFESIIREFEGFVV